MFALCQRPKSDAREGQYDQTHTNVHIWYGDGIADTAEKNYSLLLYEKS